MVKKKTIQEDNVYTTKHLAEDIEKMIKEKAGPILGAQIQADWKKQVWMFTCPDCCESWEMKMQDGKTGLCYFCLAKIEIKKLNRNIKDLKKSIEILQSANMFFHGKIRGCKRGEME